MRARAVIMATAASAGIILLGWQTGTGKEGAQALAITQPAGPTGGVSGSGGGSSGTAPGSGGPPGSPGASASSGSGPSRSSASSGPGSPASSGTSSSGTASSGGGSSPNAAISGTFKGSSIGTRFGSVQVQVTIANGAITDVSALQLTDRDDRSVSISNRAAPVLRSEVLAAQSANVQTIGGATYTSEGYLSSLQAALDSAKFQTQAGG